MVEEDALCIESMVEQMLHHPLSLPFVPSQWPPIYPPADQCVGSFGLKNSYRCVPLLPRPPSDVDDNDVDDDVRDDDDVDNDDVGDDDDDDDATELSMFALKPSLRVINVCFEAKPQKCYQCLLWSQRVCFVKGVCCLLFGVVGCFLFVVCCSLFVACVLLVA